MDNQKEAQEKKKTLKKGMIALVLAAVVIGVIAAVSSTSKKEELDGIYHLSEMAYPEKYLPYEIRYVVRVNGSDISIQMAMERDGDNTYTYNGIVERTGNGSARIIFDDNPLEMVSPLQASIVHKDNWTYLRITSEDPDLWPTCDFKSFADRSGNIGSDLNMFLERQQKR